MFFGLLNDLTFFVYISTLFLLNKSYIHYCCWIHDMRTKFKFQIQNLHDCDSSKVDIVYTVSVKKINPFLFFIPLYSWEDRSHYETCLILYLFIYFYRVHEQFFFFNTARVAYESSRSRAIRVEVELEFKSKDLLACVIFYYLLKKIIFLFIF